MPVPILILAFQNPEALSARIEEAGLLGLSPIYVSIDGTSGKEFAYEISENQRKCVGLATEYKSNNTIHNLKISTENLGQSVAIPRAIDWFFSDVDSGIILEEDCRLDTSPDFQEALNLFPKLLDNRDVAAVCLSNLWPPALLDTQRLSEKVNFIKTQFFNSWGWYSSEENWREFRRSGNEARMLFDAIEKLNLGLLAKLFLVLEWRNHIKRSRKINKPTWALRFTMDLIVRSKLVAIPVKNFVVHEPSPNAVHIKKNPRWAVTEFKTSVRCSFKSLEIQQLTPILESFTVANVHGASILRFLRGKIRRVVLILNIVE
ncbi:hypothetical protein MCEMRE22_00041 [Candidatus Nanopelagicaceae bacterium]